MLLCSDRNRWIDFCSAKGGAKADGHGHGQHEQGGCKVHRRIVGLNPEQL
jgi:hypothetical protein